MLATRFRAQPIPPSSPISISLGDLVPRFTGIDSTGKAAEYLLANDEGAATLVLAFDTDCVHTEAVQKEWRAWLGSHRSIRSIAVARDSIGSARAYRDAQRWDLHVFSLDDPRPDTPEHALAARSPWLFVFDHAGALRWEGHGARIAEVEEVLMTLATSS